MQKPNLGISVHTNVIDYTVANESVPKQFQRYPPIILPEQLRDVYCEFNQIFDEIKKVHPQVLYIIRTGIDAKLNNEGEIFPSIELQCLRYVSPIENHLKNMKKLEDSSHMFPFYQCTHKEHTTGFECGPWFGRDRKSVV